MEAGEYGEYREEQEQLLARIDAVEARLDALEAGADEDADGLTG